MAFTIKGTKGRLQIMRGDEVIAIFAAGKPHAQHFAECCRDALQNEFGAAIKQAIDPDNLGTFHGIAIPKILAPVALLLHASEGKEPHERSFQQNMAVSEFVTYCEEAGIVLAKRIEPYSSSDEQAAAGEGGIDLDEDDEAQS